MQKTCGFLPYNVLAFVMKSSLCVYSGDNSNFLNTKLYEQSLYELLEKQTNLKLKYEVEKSGKLVALENEIKKTNDRLDKLQSPYGYNNDNKKTNITHKVKNGDKISTFKRLESKKMRAQIINFEPNSALLFRLV